jgi:hypothetical protein
MPSDRRFETSPATSSRVALGGVCGRGDAVSAPADAGGTEQVAALLASARRRGRVLRFQAWPDGRRPERNRAASDPRLCLLFELARRRTHAQVQAQRSRMGRCRLSPVFSHEQPPLARVAFRTSAPRIERARTKRRRSRDDSNATGRARSTAHGWGDRAYLKPAPDENCGHERGGHPHTHDAQGLTDESIKFRTADSPGTVIPRGRLLRRADP